MTEEIEITNRMKAALVAGSIFHWTMFYWKREFTISPERQDLPAKWHGKQVMSEKQRLMACDRSSQLAYRTSRKVSKTDFMGARFFWWTFWHAGKAPTDGLLHCPREHHLTNFRMRIEKKYQHTKLFHAVLIGSINRSKGVITTNTGVTWYLRIEGKTKTGESMVGPAALYEIGDEQDYAAQEAYNERQAAMLPGAKRVLAGVPRGVQGGPFWSIANRSEMQREWSVYTGKDGFNCFINPIYRSEKARRDLEVNHGGKESQAYQTQVLGLDGMKVFSSFPVIPQAVEDFKLISVSGEEVDHGVLLSYLGSIPQTPGEAYIIAGDLGRSPSPTELSAFRLSEGAWLQMCRLHIIVADSFQVAEAIHQLDRHLPHPSALIGIDAHGQGTGIYDNLHKNEKWALYNYMDRVVDVEFNNVIEDERRMIHKTCKSIVRMTDFGWYCDRCQIPVPKSENVAPTRIPTKQWAFAAAKDSFSSGDRWLRGEKQRMDYPPVIISAHDEDTIMALEGTTEKETVGGRIQWDAPSRHLVDMILATTVTIDRLRAMTLRPVADWLDEVGWSGGIGSGVMPWEAANVSR